VAIHICEGSSYRARVPCCRSANIGLPARAVGSNGWRHASMATSRCRCAELEKL
jgi:hypothetical protein